MIGTLQSPIKIETANSHYVPVSDSFLTFKYSKPLLGKVIAEKKIFRFNAPPDEKNAPEWSITVGGVTWLIRQIHMHAKAEHLVDSDDPMPFEAHLVHTLPKDPDANGEKLVIGVFILPGIETREKRSLGRFLESQARLSVSLTDPTDIDPRDFLPDSGLNKFFRYNGSLTGDPYSEDVNWYVMCDVGIVLPEKFHALEEFAEQHRREVQPLNRRFVLRSFKV